MERHLTSFHSIIPLNGHAARTVTRVRALDRRTADIEAGIRQLNVGETESNARQKILVVTEMRQFVFVDMESEGSDGDRNGNKESQRGGEGIRRV